MNQLPTRNRLSPGLIPQRAYAAQIEMQQVCGSFPAVHHFLPRVLLCRSVCVYKRRSKEAIKTPHSIAARRQEFLYKQRSSGICRGTLPLTRSANTSMKTRLHMNMEKDKAQMSPLLGGCGKMTLWCARVVLMSLRVSIKMLKKTKTKSLVLFVPIFTHASLGT